MICGEEIAHGPAVPSGFVFVADDNKPAGKLGNQVALVIRADDQKRFFTTKVNLRRAVRHFFSYIAGLKARAISWSGDLRKLHYLRGAINLVLV